EGLVALELRIASGDTVEQGSGVDPVERLGARLELALLETAHPRRLDPLVIAGGGQIGADVEGLAASGGNRDEAIENDQVAHRPRCEWQHEGQGEQGAGRAPWSPTAPPADQDERQDRKRRADEQVLGPDQRGDAKEDARERPAPGTGLIRRPEEGEHGGGEEEERGRLPQQGPTGVGGGGVGGGPGP